MYLHIAVGPGVVHRETRGHLHPRLEVNPEACFRLNLVLKLPTDVDATSRSCLRGIICEEAHVNTNLKPQLMLLYKTIIELQLRKNMKTSLVSSLAEHAHGHFIRIQPEHI